MNPPLLETIRKLPPHQLLAYCQMSQEYLRELQLTPERVPGKSFKEKIEFLASFTWEWIPGDTYSEKGKYLKDTFSSLIGFLSFTTFDHPTEDIIHTGVTDILNRAVETGNPVFVEYVLNQIDQRVGPTNLPIYLHDYIYPFIRSLRNIHIRSQDQSQLNIANLFISRYDITKSSAFMKIYTNVIRRNDLPVIKSLALVLKQSSPD